MYGPLASARPAFSAAATPPFACRWQRTRGAKRAVLLPVSVPSHSALMKPAADELRERLSVLAVQAPAMRVYAFDGGSYETPEMIRDGLYRQLFNPVRWSAIVAAMIGAGAQQLVECGPGKVLAGLARRAPGARGLAILAIDDADTLQAALAVATGSDNR